MDNNRENINSMVVFENVSFSYNTVEHSAGVYDINLEIFTCILSGRAQRQNIN